MKENENVRIVLSAFDAVERQDDLQFSALIDPEFKIYWPPSLPYGGETAGPDRAGPAGVKSGHRCNLLKLSASWIHVLLPRTRMKLLCTGDSAE
jgi:hypothetical protein